MNIAIFASGKGSNFKAILEKVKKGKIKGYIRILITDRDCPAIQIAKEEEIPALILSAKNFENKKEYLERLIEICNEYNIELICLAGYLSKLPYDFVNKYYGKIINIHPALLPSFGGKGFYGINVHKAVIESGTKITGVTIHFVDREYDCGPIIAQEAIYIRPNDTPEKLSERISAIEHRLYPEIIAKICEKKIWLNEYKKVVYEKDKNLKGIKRALISVSDKTGIIEFARELEKLGIEIISTGGTSKLLKENGIDVIEIEMITNFPEILDGRVKTLNNKIFGGILFKRDNLEHINEIIANDIVPIDMVVVNLYPFEKVAQKEKNWSENLIENIDIGGVSLIRAAAKNYKDVITICDINDYSEIINLIKENKIDIETKKKFAIKAFEYTSKYDTIIYKKLNSDNHLFQKDRIELNLNKLFDLRYGENPHQKSSLYSISENLPFEKISGKELSYNNLLDAYGAVSCVMDFNKPACVIFKHITPCGIGKGMNIFEAFENAWNCDPLSAFGGIIAINRGFTIEIAEFLAKKFIEIVIAPEYQKEALDILIKKTNLRILKWNEDIRKYPLIKSIGNELLISESDNIVLGDKWEVVSGNITEKESDALKFAFTCVKHIRSNAIVLTDENKTLGIGAGQMSRVDSVFMARHKYENYLKNNTKPEILVMASDAFFPFEDAIEEAAKIGVSAIIQPGGSVIDKEIISKSKELGIKMVLTGIRHFKH